MALSIWGTDVCASSKSPAWCNTEARWSEDVGAGAPTAAGKMGLGTAGHGKDAFGTAAGGTASANGATAAGATRAGGGLTSDCLNATLCSKFNAPHTFLITSNSSRVAWVCCTKTFRAAHSKIYLIVRDSSI